MPDDLNRSTVRAHAPQPGITATACAVVFRLIVLTAGDSLQDTRRVAQLAALHELIALGRPR